MENEDQIEELLRNQLDEENTTSCHDHISPGNTAYWIPKVPEESKPKVGSTVQTHGAAYSMYKAYAFQAGFDVRKGTSRKKTTGVARVLYFVCNREGKPNVGVVDTSDIQHNKFQRRRGMFRTECKAKIVFHVVPGTEQYSVYEFTEAHNHVLISKDKMYMSRAYRQLDFSQHSMIYNLSKQKVGSVKSYRLISGLYGGYGIRGGLENDYKNSRKGMNCYIGGRDAALLTKKMNERMQYVSNFTFKVKLEGSQLDALFWADETSKFNYSQFGDVVSIDATFNTNRYDMVFVPFTGIDNHKKCVTFGAGLLSREDYNSYIWLLKTWLSAFGKEPQLVLTDQCLAMKKAVPEAFPHAHHRLCMWHITTKIPLKFSSLVKNPEFKKRFYGLVWNAKITEQQFEDGWNSMLKEFNLQADTWMKGVYKIRARWIPAFFRNVPMAGLMRTTSLSESQNWSFCNTTPSGSQLLNFMDTFDTALEKQRHNQSVNDYKTQTTFPKTLTYLPYEPHAAKVYTRRVFYQVQEEIFHSDKSCFQKTVSSHDGVDTITVLEKSKNITMRKEKHHHVDDEVQEYHYDKLLVDTEFKVTHSIQEGTFTCSCNHFDHVGLLCRHIFCVFKYYSYEEIPERYVLKRYRRDVVPSHLLTRRFQNTGIDLSSDINALEAVTVVNQCVNVLCNHPDKLKEYVAEQHSLRKKYLDDCPAAETSTRNSIYEKLLGVNDVDLVDIDNPSQCRNKGRGSRGKRLKSKQEMITLQAQRRKRNCTVCELPSHHDARNCPLRDEDT